MKARWDKDCVELQPALLSVLIGVNDIWHKLNGRYKGTVADYHDGFLALMRYADDLEYAVRRGYAEDLVEDALKELAEMCSRACASE